MTILRRSKPVLQGNLRDIKNTYPREKVVLRTAHPLSGLSDIEGIVHVESQDENGRYLIHINQEQAAQQILQLAMQHGNVEQFEIKEPTLNEIFIKVVGNNE